MSDPSQKPDGAPSAVEMEILKARERIEQLEEEKIKEEAAMEREKQLEASEASTRVGQPTGIAGPNIKERNEYLNYRDWPWYKFAVTFSGSMLVPVLPYLLLYLAASVMVHAAENQESSDSFWENVTYVPHFMMLIPLSLLLILRTGYALQKHWEARGTVTACYHHIQELIRMSHLFIDREEKEDQVALHHILRYLPVFAIVAKNNVIPNFYNSSTNGHSTLRTELAPHLSRQEVDVLVEGCTANRPLLVGTWISRWIVGLHKRGKIVGGDQAMMQFNSTIQQLLSSWMHMAKVSTSPVCFPMVHMLIYFIVIWTLTLPLCLAHTTGGYIIVAVPVIGALLHCIERLGSDLEEPFGPGPNCFGVGALVPAVVLDIKLLFWGCDVKLAPLDRDSAQDDAIGKMEAAFTMGLDTISLEFELPNKRVQSTGPDPGEPFFHPTPTSEGGQAQSTETIPTNGEEQVPLSHSGPDGLSLGARIRSKGTGDTPTKDAL